MSHDDIRAALEAATPGPWDEEWRAIPGQSYYGARLLGWQVAEIRYLASKGVTQAKIAALFEMGSGHVSDIIRGQIWPETLERDTASPTWLAELLAEVDRLARWKAEALPVIDGLQELGAELGIRLGGRITGPDALAAVKALTTRAEAAEQTNQRVRELHYPADNDDRRSPRCPNCIGKAGVHPCGCWADEDRQPVCGHCNDGYKSGRVDWPCPTIRALDGAS